VLLDGVEDDGFGLNLSVQRGDLILQSILLLPIDSVDARLLAFQRAVKVLDVQLCLHIQLIHLFTQPSDILLRLIAVLRVLVLLFLDGLGKFFHLLGELSFLFKQFIVFARLRYISHQFLLKLGKIQVGLQLFFDIGETFDKQSFVV
jgi:hypothetical protein